MTRVLLIVGALVCVSCVGALMPSAGARNHSVGPSLRWPALTSVEQANGCSLTDWNASRALGADPMFATDRGLIELTCPDLPAPVRYCQYGLPNGVYQHDVLVGCKR